MIEDPEADRFARELAAAMDERVSLLGNRVAMDRPVWALRYLGEVPADPVERAEWIRRAGAVAAYREERGYADETEAIGPAPERGSPEQRASWHAAYVALRMPEEDREVAAATDGELWARRAAYERETGWAPPYVAGELREAHLAEDTYRADAVRAWHRADAAAGDDRAGTSPAGRRRLQRAGPGSRRPPRGPDRGRRSPAPVARRHRAGPAAGARSPTPSCAAGTRTRAAAAARRQTSASPERSLRPMQSGQTEAERGRRAAARSRPPAGCDVKAALERGTKAERSSPNENGRPTATPARSDDDHAPPGGRGRSRKPRHAAVPSARIRRRAATAVARAERRTGTGGRTMTGATVSRVDAGPADDVAPPQRHRDRAAAASRPGRPGAATYNGSPTRPRPRRRARPARGHGRWARAPPPRSPTARPRFRPAGPTSKPRSPRRTKGACAATGRTEPTPPRPSCAGSSATTTTSRSAERIWAHWSAASATSSARRSR